ncbi:MAG: Ppx/GppA phosphatase family protein [Coriobacteriia bacterium]|nr:Ppx/GppA phosphatase family protein [Coriobacteriia bacterium]
MRIAAIDIGSNSIRTTVVEVPVGGPRVVLDEERAFARLGAGLAETGRLSEHAMDESVHALDMMLRIAREFEVTHVRAIATEAVRSASNGAAFVERLHDELGLDVEVISGEQEGRLALLSAVESLALTGSIAIIDIGGGSVELVRASGRDVERIVSLPLGAVVLSERFRTADPMSKHKYRDLGRHVRTTLAGALPAGEEPPAAFVGSGGTVTTLAAIVAADRSPGLVSMHGFEIGRAELKSLRERLARTTAKERAAIKGMSDGRVDLIVAGAVVLDEAMRALGCASVIANARGMREGIIIDTVERERGPAPEVDRMRSARDFGRQCRHDVQHAEQVCRLSLALFDALRSPLALDPEDRPLLEAAALLHDVGYHVSYEQHHKHSYHLITHATLPGFSAAERRLIAAIARYHAGSLPKAKHEALDSLGEAERGTVSRLAALLKIADGLDRSHGRRVDGIVAEVSEGWVRLTVTGRPPLDIEVQAAARKAALFELVWGMPVEIAGGGA